MCHLSRLLRAQAAKLAEMPQPYRASLEDQIEHLPSDSQMVRDLFRVWEQRVQAVDNARRVQEVTEDVVTEALTDVLWPSGVQNRRDALAERRAWERERRLRRPVPALAQR